MDIGQLRLAVRAALARRRQIGPVSDLEKLKASHGVDLTESLFESINDGVLVTDLYGTVLYGNPSAARIFDQPRQRPVEEWYREWEFLRPDQRTPFLLTELPPLTAARGESVDDMEIFLRRRGTPEGIFLNAHARPLLGSDGAPAGAVSVLRDISDARRAQNDLEDTLAKYHEQNELMQTVFDSISDGVLVFDTQGALLFANDSADRMVGRGMLAKSDPTRWKGSEGIFAGDETTRVPVDQLPHTRAVAGEHVEGMRLFIRNRRKPDGCHVSVDCQPMYDRTGQLSGAVMVARDQTASHRVDRALTNAFAHGRLEVLDTIVHNVGNAVNSVSIGVTTLREQVEDNVLLRRLSAVAAAVEAHKDDWQTYLATDGQGRRVLPFILALVEDFRRQNDKLVETIERVAARVSHNVEIVRTQTSAHGGAVLRTDIDLERSIASACMTRTTVAVAELAGEIEARRILTNAANCS